MISRSMLYQKPEMAAEADEAPAFFTDLNLDQVIDAITVGYEAYNLKPIFYSPLRDIETICYRHAIMQDMENAVLFTHVKSFAHGMKIVREHLIQVDKLHYKFQKEAWFLDALRFYCDTIQNFCNNLAHTDLHSAGFVAFRDYLLTYANSSDFNSLLSETKELREDMSTVKYCVLIKGDSVRVRKCESEEDYSEDVLLTFDRFKQGEVKDYRANFASWPAMNHIEEKILDFVGQLYPEIFSSLDQYYQKHGDYLDPTVAAFDRDIQFYVACLEYVATFGSAGLKFCYPRLSITSKRICNRDGFDLALAHKLVSGKCNIVCNDFDLSGKERILVVSGPNQGGKTTFARTFGQLHYIASLGCLVPGKDAQLFIPDRIFTHFEKEEDIKELRGKLEDDLVRIHDILENVTPGSIVIMNEIFTSTTLQDAIFLSSKVMKKIVDLDLLCVWVTFIDEMASFSEKTVSFVSTVVPDNPAMRTYKVVRKPADGLSYALAIAEKYRVTYKSIKERVPS
jgi:hypothetical protein